MNKRIFTIGVVSLIIDQITKMLIDMFLKLDESISIIDKFFYITKTFNTGAAFSILEGRTFILIIVSILTVLVLLKYMGEFKSNKLSNLSFGLIMGGILGNFGDRLFLGYVRDFLKFNIFGYNFPIFNIADVCIVIGIFLLIICMIRGDDKDGSNSRDRRKSKTR